MNKESRKVGKEFMGSLSLSFRLPFSRPTPFSGKLKILCFFSCLPAFLSNLFRILNKLSEEYSGSANRRRQRRKKTLASSHSLIFWLPLSSPTLCDDKLRCSVGCVSRNSCGHSAGTADATKRQRCSVRCLSASSPPARLPRSPATKPVHVQRDNRRRRRLARYGNLCPWVWR